MGRERAKHSQNTLKRRKARLENIDKANAQRRNPLGERTNTVPVQPAPSTVERLEKENRELKRKVAETTKKYWNARRRNIRLEKAATLRKLDLKQAKVEAARLRGVTNMLGKNLKDLKEEADTSTSLLRARIKALVEVQKKLTDQRVVLWKRCRRLEAAKRRLKRQMHKKLKTRLSTYRMMHKGCYTPAARQLARLLVSVGTAEAKVGQALVQIGDALGIKVNRHLNKRSVQRFMLEEGVRVPLKSHMKSKPQRASELKKAITRFHARGETKETAYQLLDKALNADKLVGDHLYESDNDDL